MFNFIGRKERLSDVAEKLLPLVLLEETQGRKTPAPEAIALLAPLQDKDARIYERAAKKLEDGDMTAALEVLLQAGAKVEPEPLGLISHSTFLQWDNDRKLAWAEEKLEEIAEDLEDGQVRAMPEDSKVVLACVRHGLRARVTVYHGYYTDFEVDLDNRRGHLLLMYDADKTPKGELDPSDPFYDEGAEVCRVYGSGVYIEGATASAKPMFDLVDAMPEAVRSKLIGCAEESFVLQVSSNVFLRPQAPIVWLVNRESVIPTIDDLAQIAQYFAEGDGAAATAPQHIALQGGATAMQAGPATVPVIQHTCGYCRTRFNYTDDPRCPTCGAPATG